jgi:acyl-coenzyme A synthetase/AMP-(fatty) acid ligase
LKSELDQSHFFRELFLKQNKNDTALLYSESETISFELLAQYAYKIFSILLDRPNPSAPFLISTEKKPELYGAVLTSIFMGIPLVPTHRNWPLNKIKNLMEQTQADCWLGGDLHPQWHKIKETIKIRLIDSKNLVKQKPTEWTSPLSSNAYYMSSSGSTGKPKLILITQNNFFTLIKNLLDIYHINKIERVSNAYDLTFDPALVDIFLTLLQGGTLVPLLPSNQYDVFNFISKNKITVWSSTPSLILLNRDRQKKQVQHSLETLRLSLFTGEVLSPAFVRSWQNQCPNSKIENLYGPTETTVWATRFSISNHTQPIAELNISIGKPLPEFSAVVLDSQDQPIFNEAIGELCLSGPQIFSGYQNQETHRLVHFPWDSELRTWYRTGDLVNQVGQNFYFRGRVDFLFKIAGQLVSPEEIEDQIFQVFGCEIVLIPIKFQVIAICFTELETQKILAITNWFTEELPRGLIPKDLLYCKSPPRTTSGKIHRSTLTFQAKLNKYPSCLREAS